MQRDGHIPATYGPGTHECNKEIRDLIMCYVDDVVIAINFVDCTQFWEAVADAKHPRHEEALSGVKATRARLMNEAESRRKETTPSYFTTKKVKILPDEVVASSLEADLAGRLKVGYGLAARTAL